MCAYRNTKASKIIALLTAFTVLICLSLYMPVAVYAAEYTTQKCSVVRVVDGDTIIVKYNGENTRTRLIGVDTPESVNPDASRNCKEGKIASKYTKKRLTGKTVKIVPGKDPTDKYGRMLAYVYIGKEFYNYKLLKIGYARMMTIAPNTQYVSMFKKAQSYAKKHNRGFWKTGYYK